MIRQLFLCFFLSFNSFVCSLDPSNPKWDWMDLQINEDFQSVKKFTDSDIENTYKKMEERIGTYCLEKFIIYHNKVFGPQGKMFRFLNELLNRYELPDMKIIYHVQDVLREGTVLECSVPILSSVKAPGTDGKIIHFIDWYYDITNQDSGYNAMIKEIDSENHHFSWEDKRNILFWRGMTTSPIDKWDIVSQLAEFPRGILVLLSLQFPDLIDARFNKLVNPSVQDHFPIASYVSVGQHLSYKFQIAMDGITTSYPGYQWRLYSNCVTLKQGSPDTMWYFGPIKPWIHYVPVDENLSDLIEKLNWLIEHDAEAQKIAKHARKFAEENLMPEHMLLYGYKVLKKYASCIENSSPSCDLRKRRLIKRELQNLKINQ